MKDQKWLLECNIDDMPGEIFSYVMDLLLDAGALDVTYTSIQMKKNRPGTKLSVLVDETNLEKIEVILLTETSTFGIRKMLVERTILERSFEILETPFGPLSIKLGYLDGKVIKRTPEYEALKIIAQETGLPLIDVYKQVQTYIEKMK
jgi:uncharacterized protein (DUF111 family)